MKPLMRGASVVGVVVCAALVSGAGAQVAHADKVKIKLGLWEMSGQMKMGGMDMPVAAQKHCITKKDLVPGLQAATPGMNCKTKQKVTANTVTWTVACKMDGGGSMKGVGKVVYTGTKFTGSMSITANVPKAGEMKGKMTMAGTYVGACPK